MNSRQEIGVCCCTRVIFKDDIYFVQKSKLLCKTCGPNGLNEPFLRSVCSCGIKLFEWTRIRIDPCTGVKLCCECGDPKIAEARKQKSLRRKERKRQWKIKCESTILNKQ